MTTTQHTTILINKYEDVSIDDLIEKLQELKEDLQGIGANNTYISIDYTYDFDGGCDINLKCTYHMEEP